MEHMQLLNDNFSQPRASPAANGSAMDENTLISQSELYMSSKVVVILYSIIFVISSIGNTTVFISLLRTGTSRRRISLLILNLTVADLIVTYIMIPMEIGWRITNQWLAGDFMCRIMQAFRAFGPYLSSMVLVCISLDRYFAVIYPLKVNDAHRRSKIMLTFAWLTSIVCSVPQTIVFHTASHPLFPDFVQCVSYNSLTEWQEIFYSTFGIAALYLIPLVIIVCCYTRILWEIYRKSRESTEDMQSSRNLIHRTDSDNGSEGRHRRNNSYMSKNKFHLRRSDIAQIEKARIRTLRMTLIIVVAFVWCWTPYASIVLLFHFYKQKVDNMHKDLKDALFMFAVSNSCVNPLVYGSYTMNFSFRRYFNLFTRKKSPWRSDSMNKKTGLNSSHRSVYLDDTNYTNCSPPSPLSCSMSLEANGSLSTLCHSTKAANLQENNNNQLCNA